MKRIIPFIALLIAGCAAPKQLYYFDHYNVSQNTNHNVTQNTNSKSSKLSGSPSPLDIRTETLLAEATVNEVKSASEQNTVVDYNKLKGVSAGNENKTIRQSQFNIREMVSRDQVTNERQFSTEKDVSKNSSRENRKELISALKQFRKEMRSKSGANSNAPLHNEATQKLDNELIVAISFAAVGITLSILGGLGAGFWIAGVICLGVGVYFFVDWLSKR